MDSRIAPDKNVFLEEEYSPSLHPTLTQVRHVK
jgi:hypothetical protein